MERATRGSRCMFWTFFQTPMCAQTNSSFSMPTQTTVTCGLPSGLMVVRCASGPLAMRSRADAGMIMAPPNGCQECCCIIAYRAEKRDFDTLDIRYNNSYTINMKTAISLPDKLFQTAEAFAQEHGLSRSELYARALLLFLQAQRYEGITD